MTKEEAIEILNNTTFIAPEVDVDTALEMAISALEQQTVEDVEREYEKSKALFRKIVESEDAVSRQAVINAIENDCMKGGLGSCFACYDDAQAFRGEIEKLPSGRRGSG